MMTFSQPIRFVNGATVEGSIRAGKLRLRVAFDQTGSRYTRKMIVLRLETAGH